ncbi:hypothetical protein KAX02_00795, partial [candidate division WOR-3 bacterium]|nr:hypothetical protein [candidate division WOR-3 bacterium]
TLTIPIQVNGKLRATFEVRRGTEKEEIERLAKKGVDKWIKEGVKRIIYVKDKLVNIVTE